MIRSDIKDKIITYVQKQCDKEKDKWESGLKNDYFAWDDALQEVKEKLTDYVRTKK